MHETLSISLEDAGKDLQIAYNSLNLPRRIWRESTGEQMLIDYTYGGSKLRTQTHAADGTVEERLYLGGFEFVTDSASGALTVENYQHPEGRVVFDADSIPHYQYRIADHLGNTVVFFEDKNGDGLISSEQDTDDPELLEVLQRRYYYPFGLAMSGTWLSQTTPLQRYLYNGKELHGELGLGWLDYGFRYYDAAIARWNAVDPLAEKYYSWSGYNYVMGNPVRLVDPDGRDTSFISDVARENYLAARNEVQSEIDKINNNEKWSEKKKARKRALYEKDLEVFKRIEDPEGPMFLIGDDLRDGRAGGFAKTEDGLILNFAPDATSDEVFHELIHGIQYLDGRISFDNEGKPLNYSYAHEYEAYDKQWDFSLRYRGKDPAFAVDIIKAFEQSFPDGMYRRRDIIQLYVKKYYSSNKYIVKEF